jgi:toluene monooxygenase electron transfer component
MTAGVESHAATVRMQIELKAKNQTHAFSALHGESVLYAGMRHGLELPYGCATGTCGTCRVKCLDGSCASAWPEAPGRRVGKHDTGDLLMCQCTPINDAVFETASTVYRADPGACLPDYVGARLADVRLLARDVMAFSLALDTPMRYEAGQFVALRVPAIAGHRVYSITNFARSARQIDLLIKRKPGGVFSDWLFGESRIGESLEVFGPMGRATFSPSAGKHLLIIAGGSGIAGMMSILARAVQEGYFHRHRGHVFFGVRGFDDAFYLRELAGMKASIPEHLAITVALSDEDVPDRARERHPDLTFARGFVHQVASDSMAGGYADVRAYVAGPPQAVDATLRYLVRDAKLSPADIRYDKFG